MLIYKSNVCIHIFLDNQQEQLKKTLCMSPYLSLDWHQYITWIMLNFHVYLMTPIHHCMREMFWHWLSGWSSHTFSWVISQQCYCGCNTDSFRNKSHLLENIYYMYGQLGILTHTQTHTDPDTHTQTQTYRNIWYSYLNVLKQEGERHF